MLPFILKTVEEPVHRLHVLNSENSTVDVDVQTELYISEFDSQVWNLPAVLRAAQEAAYKAFTTYLQQISEPQPFFPIDLLSQYPYQRYTLILSVARFYEFREILQSTPDTLWRDGRNSSFEYDGYELSLSAKHHILDSSAYLVAPRKFTVFVRRVNTAETIRFFRSRFIDLTRNSPPPLQLNAQEIIEVVQQDITSREAAMPIGQLLMFPLSAETELDAVELFTNCPECTGDVKQISRSFFCLECDWDNLPPLAHKLSDE